TIGFLLYRNNRQKQKANLILQEKNSEIERTLNELKATQSQLIQSEKMASLGELTAGIAHEIQNPLNFVNNFSEVNNELIDELKGERSRVKGERNETLEEDLLNDISDNSKKINQHGLRASNIVKGMLEHSRKSSGIKEPTDINVLCDEYVKLSYQALRAKNSRFNCDVKLDLDPNLPKVNVVAQDISRVILNLVNNAFYAVNLACLSRNSIENMRGLSEVNEYKPVVIISTKKFENQIEIKITDNGIGIPDNIKDKILQPFFTTKPTGQGTGLGLSLSYDIIKAHRGEISAGPLGKVETKEGEGTVFIIQLPL
ncbi:MAG: ATP-binding protein, partial [Saprospiraceae bacterium]